MSSRQSSGRELARPARANAPVLWCAYRSASSLTQDGTWFGAGALRGDGRGTSSGGAALPAPALPRSLVVGCATLCSGGDSMPATTTMTVRLPEEVAARLDRLARATDRTRAYLACRAIEQYVELQEWQVAAVEDGVRQADAAGAVFLDHDQVEARLGRAPRKPRRTVSR